MKVRLYVEGGPKGTHADGLRRFKNAFKQHLAQLGSHLNTLEVSPGGSIDQTIRDFVRALREAKQDCIVALLVDSDAPVTAHTPAIHLETKLNSANLPRDRRTNIFLMVQFMEAWLITDAAALEKCFGSKVRTIRFPQNPDIEAVPKRDVLDALDLAAQSMPTGHYHKIRDGIRILAELKPDTVAQRSKHARALHEFLRQSAHA